VLDVSVGIGAEARDGDVEVSGLEVQARSHGSSAKLDDVLDRADA
jgi:hypothetical protein